LHCIQSNRPSYDFQEINPTPIYPEILSVKLKILAGVMTAVTKILRNEPVPLYKHLMKGIVGWLAEGFTFIRIN
jgi:hypothetical protein